MDGVLVDFQSGIDKLDDSTKAKYEGRLDEVPGIFGIMQPMEGAIEAVHQISEKFDVFILSTAPWLNPSAWTDKIDWIHKHFGSDKDSVFYKKVFITHHKNLVKGDYLIDDRDKWGADGFEGKLIKFGSREFASWERIAEYLRTELELASQYEIYLQSEIKKHPEKEPFDGSRFCNSFWRMSGMDFGEKKYPHNEFSNKLSYCYSYYRSESKTVSEFIKLMEQMDAYG
jgi:5'(3')-deoxyribonucleotidase